MVVKRYELHPQGDVLFRLSCPTKDKKSDGKETSISTDTTTQSLASMSLESSSDGVAKDVNEKCFLVSSAHLSLASKVFSAMLQAGGFKEGETLRSAGYVEISLPDDDPDAFELLMNIIHNKSWLLPRRLDFKALVNLSILADKYQMAKTLVFYVDTWVDLLRPLRPDAFTDELAPWLSLSCTFDLAADFKHLTRIAIVESRHKKLPFNFGSWNSGSWSLDSWEGVALPLPFGLIEKVEEQRQLAVGAGFAVIQAQLDSLRGPTSVCTYQSLDSESSTAKASKAKPVITTGRSSSPSTSNPTAPAPLFPSSSSGAAVAAYTFGNLGASSSPFGASSTPAATPASGGLFGSTAARNTSSSAATPAPSLFGSNTLGAATTPAPSVGLFGSRPAGNPSSTTAPPAPSLFGSNAATTTTAPSVGLFGPRPVGNPSSTTAPPATSLFGSGTSTATATPTLSSGGPFGLASVRSTPTYMSSAEMAAANRRTGCNGMMLGTFMRSISKRKLWPLPPPPYISWSMAGLASQVGFMQCESLCHALNVVDPKFDGLPTQAHGIDTALVKKLAKISESMVGLDLETFKKAGY